MCCGDCVDGECGDELSEVGIRNDHKLDPVKRLG
jgi:hypothetical protein